MPNSWDSETIAEHVHTAATLRQLLDYAKPKMTAIAIHYAEENIKQCRRDLASKMHAQGLLAVRTITHTAELLSNGMAVVTRREGIAA